MDEFYALVVLATILWSAIGGLFGKKKPPQHPPSRRPGHGRPGSGTDGARRRGEWEDVLGREPIAAGGGAHASGEDGSASGMIPDELWEILTGERREPVLVPDPNPYDDEVADYDETAAYGDEIERDYPEPVSLERPVQHEPPVIVSLETLPPPMEVRHRRFHEKLDATPAVAGEPRRANRSAQLQTLRRAMVLREVLGPPKALE